MDHPHNSNQNDDRVDRQHQVVHDKSLSDEESRAAMRAYLQRSEVRLSTLHRVAQAMLGGSALVLLLPLFIRDGFPRLTTLVISSYDAGQYMVVTVGIAIAALLSVVLPVIAIYLLVGDLLSFYFSSNTFGSAKTTTSAHDRTRFNPRFIIPGLGFNNDELNERTQQQLDAERQDSWTKSHLVPKTLNDRGWRNRFDTRIRDIWGTEIPAGHAGDDERIRHRYRLAGIHRDRRLAQDVARTEALLARHVLHLRIVILRYSKALLLLISTTVATLAASGFIEYAEQADPAAGWFTEGFPYRYGFLVALVYVGWAPLAARSVTAPLRWIHRSTPGVGDYGDSFLDKRLTQFESATVLATLVVLIGAVGALIGAGWGSKGWTGVVLAVLLGSGGSLAWILALRGYSASAKDTMWAAILTITGNEAPHPAPDIVANNERARLEFEASEQTADELDYE